MKVPCQMIWNHLAYIQFDTTESHIRLTTHLLQTDDDMMRDLAPTTIAPSSNGEMRKRSLMRH